MSKKTVLLNAALTYGGTDYAPGIVEMPEKAADYALRRQFAEKIKGDGDDETNGSTDKSSDPNGQNEDQTRLLEDLPMRHVFAKLGPDYDSNEKIKALSRADLIKVNGIAEGSADKIIAYFAEKK